MKPTKQNVLTFFCTLTVISVSYSFCPSNKANDVRWLRVGRSLETAEPTTSQEQVSSFGEDHADKRTLAQSRSGYESKDVLRIVPDDTAAVSPRMDLSSLLNPVCQVLGSSFMALGMALALITWETISYDFALPSRQTRSAVVQEELYHSPLNSVKQQWGKVTVQGMGFGYSERRILATRSAMDEDSSFQLSDRSSYNEVMLRHRQDRVPSWKQRGDSTSVPESSLHTMLAALESLTELKALALDYQWDILRAALRSELWQTELNEAAARLRLTNDLTSSVIGFDWGSCAWRQCGAWADWQESLDQLDALLGMLEPNEVVFCLDIVERSLRDVLAVVPPELWGKADWQTYQRIPDYQPYPSSTADSSFIESEEGADDPYLQALMELRVD